MEREDNVYLTRALLEQASEAFREGRDPFKPLLPGARLCSVGIGDHQWERTEQAYCVSHALALSARSSRAASLSHDAPARDCQCGLWALRTREQVENFWGGYGASPDAIGEVQIWGRVFEHKLGYRAQYARPARLWLHHPGEEGQLWAEELREFYGCEVTWERQLTSPKQVSGPQQFVTTSSPPTFTAAQVYSGPATTGANAAMLAYVNGIITTPKRRPWPKRLLNRAVGLKSEGLSFLGVTGIVGCPAVVVFVLGAWVSPWAFLGEFLAAVWMFWVVADDV